jgi:hypothetical protein
MRDRDSSIARCKVRGRRSRGPAGGYSESHTVAGIGCAARLAIGLFAGNKYTIVDFRVGSSVEVPRTRVEYERRFEA